MNGIQTLPFVLVGLLDGSDPSRCGQSVDRPVSGDLIPRIAVLGLPDTDQPPGPVFAALAVNDQGPGACLEQSVGLLDLSHVLRTGCSPGKCIVIDMIIPTETLLFGIVFVFFGAPCQIDHRLELQEMVNELKLERFQLTRSVNSICCFAEIVEQPLGDQVLEGPVTQAAINDKYRHQDYKRDWNHFAIISHLLFLSCGRRFMDLRRRAISERHGVRPLEPPAACPPGSSFRAVKILEPKGITWSSSQD
jgi:hypothetical protein